MKLNCQQGDIAIVVGGAEEWLGKIVTCEKFIGTIPDYNYSCKDVWRVDNEFSYTILSTGQGFLVPYIADQYLRPLRDEEGTDEMILLAGNPNKQPAEV